MTHPFIQKWQPKNNQGISHKNNYASKNSNKESFTMDKRYEDVEYVVRQIEAIQLDLTTPYKYWVDLGFSFSNEFG